MSIELTKDKQI